MTNASDAEMFVRELTAASHDKTGLVLQVLNALQHAYGYLPPEGIEALAADMDVPLEEIEQFAGFFSTYSLEPHGRFLVEVCDGTACHAMGSMKLISKLEMLLGIHEGETTPDGLITLRRVHCVGSCSSAPVVSAGGVTHGKVRISQLPDILEEVRGHE